MAVLDFTKQRTDVKEENKIYFAIKYYDYDFYKIISGLKKKIFLWKKIILKFLRCTKIKK